MLEKSCGKKKVTMVIMIAMATAPMAMIATMTIAITNRTSTMVADVVDDG